jgi:hypothetical protein
MGIETVFINVSWRKACLPAGLLAGRRVARHADQFWRSIDIGQSKHIDNVIQDFKYQERRR